MKQTVNLAIWGGWDYLPIFLGVFVGILIVNFCKWAWRNNRWSKPPPDQDRAATTAAIRVHLRALGVHTDHLTDEELEQRVLALNRGLRAYGVQMREAAVTVRQVARVLGSAWRPER